MRLLKLGAIGLMTILVGSACTVNLSPGDNLFATGTSFVVSGTAALIDGEGPCLVWIGDNGATYHLFQGVGLANESFDRVTTPGTRSRLQLATRSDLTLDCHVGTIAEVQDVLEIVE